MELNIPGSPIGALSATKETKEGIEFNLKAFHNIGLDDSSDNVSELLRQQGMFSYTITLKEVSIDSFTEFVSTVVPTKLIDLQHNVRLLSGKEEWWHLAIQVGAIEGNLIDSDYDLNYYRIKFDKYKLIEHGIHMGDIARFIRNYTEIIGIAIVYTPDVYGIMDIVKNDTDGSDIFGMPPLYNIIDFDTVIKGCTNVEGIEYDLPNIKINGRELYGFLKSIKCIDSITINSPIEVERYFGVEAARHKFFSLLSKNSSNSKSSGLVADILTFDGTINKIGKVAFDKRSVLTSMGLGNPTRDLLKLTNSSVVVDDLKRPHSSFMVNSRVNTGTGYCKIKEKLEVDDTFDKSILKPL